MAYSYNSELACMLAELANDTYGPLQYTNKRLDVAPILDLKKQLAIDVLKNEAKKVKQAESQYLEGYKIVDSIVCNSGVMAGTPQYFGCFMFKHSDWDLALKVLYAPFKQNDPKFKSVMQYTHDKTIAEIKDELEKLWTGSGAEKNQFSAIWTWLESCSKERRIVIAFRGTKKIKDWMSNLGVSMSAHKWGQVHSGFLSIYETGRAALFEKLKKLIPMDRALQDQTYLLVTGHSLGGALATLCTADLYKEYIALPTPICYTFASPRVGNDVFAAEFNKALAKTYSTPFGTLCSARFFRTKDIVPTIPKSATYTHVDNSYELFGKDSSGAGGGVLAGGKPHGMAKYRELIQGNPTT